MYVIIHIYIYICIVDTLNVLCSHVQKLSRCIYIYIYELNIRVYIYVSLHTISIYISVCVFTDLVQSTSE